MDIPNNRGIFVNDHIPDTDLVLHENTFEETTGQAQWGDFWLLALSFLNVFFYTCQEIEPALKPNTCHMLFTKYGSR